MLAVLAASLPRESDAYAYEFKWDGYRAITLWDGKRLQLVSRNGNDLLERFPEFAPLARALGPTTMILDGEIVAMGAGSTFSLLQQRLGMEDRRHKGPISVGYMIFDLLYYDGRFITALPYEKRRGALESLRLAGPAWAVPPYEVGAGADMMEVARGRGMEGVIAKRLGSPYRSGQRHEDWLKIKILRRDEFVIGGWLDGGGALRGMLGSLLLGYYEGGRLRFAGKVGTGFSDQERTRLQALLQKLGTASSPFAEPVPLRGVHFVRPSLVAEVQYYEWTHLNKFRHPSYKGLRMDKAPSDVTAASLTAVTP